MDIKIKSFSVKGREEVNEDYFVGKILNKKTAIAVLCDGMGGLSFGDTAAKIVADTVMSFLIEHIASNSAKADNLLNAIIYADECLSNVERIYHSKMGTAIATVVVLDQMAYVAWLGNVRVYSINKAGEQRLLSSDHITEVGYGDVRLSRCVKGNRAIRDIPVVGMGIDGIDKICLCSDGYYNLFPVKAKPFDINHLKEETPNDDATLAIIELD